MDKSIAVRRIWTMILASAIAGQCGCSRGKRDARREWPAMGTMAALTVPESDSGALPQYASASANRIAELESALSVYREGSDISRINASAGAVPVRISEHTRRILEMAVHYAEITAGAFDPAIAPVTRLWGFGGGKRPEHAPDAAAIGSILAKTGIRHLRLDAETAYLDVAGAALDLGGIAKGYAVDACCVELETMGATDALIDIGGNMRCCGANAQRGNGRRWVIGVRNPFDRQSILGTVELSAGMAVSTSGNYERFVVIDGAAYAHIIDPRTGRPVSGMAGATVLAPTATEADALSTAVFVLGVKESLGILRKNPDCRALLVPDARPVRILVTAAMRESFKPAPEFSRSVELLGSDD